MSVPDNIAHIQPVYVTLATRRGQLRIAGEERAVCNQGTDLLDKVIASGFTDDVRISVKARDHHAYTRTFGYLSSYRNELMEIERRKAKGVWPQ